MVADSEKKVKPHYTRSSFSGALVNIGIKRRDIVFTHSNIGFFGVPKGGNSILNVFKTIFNSFFDVIGSEGTLVAPTFTYSFPNGKVFDPDNTPSDCGIFSEMLRKYPEACRSKDPCVSVAAVGGRAEEMTQNVPENAYGPGSFFDRFFRANGVVCNMNFDAASTLVHYVERALEVPYRYDKTFTGIMRENGVDREKKSTIFVNYLAKGNKVKFEPFDRLAREKGLYKTCAVGRGFVGAIKARDTFDLIQKTLPERPWFLAETKTLGIEPDLNNEAE